MPYRPKYCCQCGETIERADWKPWHSRRFCELCETDYRIYDWLPYLTGIGLVLVVFVSSFYFQKAEKPLRVASEQSATRLSNNKNAANVQNTTFNQNAVPQVSTADAVQTAQTFNGTTLKSPTKATDLKIKPVASAPVEKTYFCGAATKKGAPCSRRVKGGGRCWQHEGQAALSAQDKLLANQ